MKVQLTLLFFLVTLSSCRQMQNGGEGGGGGSVPSAEEMNAYLNQSTVSELPRCSNLSVDEHLEQREHPLIIPSGRNQWPDKYSAAIAEQYDKDYMRPLRERKIKESDLEKIGCPGYNYATREEKKKFWILWMSSIAKPESNFNSATTYNETDGTVSRGLLSIDVKAGNIWCKDLKRDMKVEQFDAQDMHTPKTNLQCGLIMMQTQLLGAPLKNKGGNLYQSRSDLEGSLFAAPAWYWSVLAANKKRLEVIDWFKVHARRQLPFCSRREYVLETPEKNYQVKLASELSSWTKTNNCEAYAEPERTICLSPKTEEDATEMSDSNRDPNLGEKRPTQEESCDLVDDTARGSRFPKAEAGYGPVDNASTITK